MLHANTPQIHSISLPTPTMSHTPHASDNLLDSLGVRGPIHRRARSRKHPDNVQPSDLTDSVSVGLDRGWANSSIWRRFRLPNCHGGMAIGIGRRSLCPYSVSYSLSSEVWMCERTLCILWVYRQPFQLVYSESGHVVCFEHTQARPQKHTGWAKAILFWFIYSLSMRDRALRSRDTLHSCSTQCDTLLQHVVVRNSAQRRCIWVLHQTVIPNHKPWT